MSLSRHPVFPIALQPCVSRLELGATEQLFRAGTPPRYIHFIEEGAVRLVRHGRQGEEVMLHGARPGEFLAEASLDASVTGDFNGSLAALARVSRTCMACHATYRIQ